MDDSLLRAKGGRGNGGLGKIAVGMLAWTMAAGPLACGGSDKAINPTLDSGTQTSADSLISIACVGNCTVDSGNVGPITVVGNGIAWAVAVALAPHGLAASVGARTRLANPVLWDVQNWQNVQSVRIKLTTDPAACAREQAGALLAGGSQLQLDIAAPSSGFAPGTYPIGAATGAPGANASASSMDTSCQQKLLDSNRVASTGQVTISEVTATSIAGSLDLVFPMGEHFTGTFRIPVCSVAQQAGPQLVCQAP